MNMYIFFIVLYSYECKGMNLAVVDVVVIFFIIFFWLALSSLFDRFKIVFIVSLVCIDDNNDYRGIDKHQKRAVIGLVNRARTFVNKMSKIHWTKNTIRRKLKWFFSRRIDKYSNKRNQQMIIVVRFFMASTDLTFIWWPYLVHLDEFFFDFREMSWCCRVWVNIDTLPEAESKQQIPGGKGVFLSSIQLLDKIKESTNKHENNKCS